ncbi:uncharacterized protein LOC119724777 [Patiria miniata]|uniref:Uncharacterized protein n=1 Tax=Patiria miniata TaxID=46514 RepID=A0A913ZLI4_PATMI|nr:uncharacterized protein LOC119724777 [Patiria miniata]
MIKIDQHHTELMCSMSPTRCLYILVMSASLLGSMLGASGKSNNVIEGLVSDYLKEEGRLEIEGRTIVYKAYLREFTFPTVFDAIATDSASGITASTSKEEKFDDPQDAYHKAVANLLAVLREKGLMKNPNPKPTPTPEPEQKSEQSQNQEPEKDPTPGGDSVSEPEKPSPAGPDPAIDESQSKNSGDDLEGKMEERDGHQVGQENVKIWAVVLQALCTISITAILELIPCSPLKTVTVGSLGILLAGIVFYCILGWNIFMSGAIAIAAFVFVEILQASYKKLGLPNEEVMKQIQAIVKPTAVFLLEVVPDCQGSYAAQKMKPARPTKEMLKQTTNYVLGSKCKGLAFILNNSDFDQCEREGSQIDMDNMKHLFQELGYEIVCHEDLTGQEITENFKEFASKFNQEGARYDSAVIVLMSHGDKGVILGTDRAHVKLRDLQRELEADQCPGLKGKPKMYFVQACRGRLSAILPVAHDGPNPSSDAPGSIRPCQELVPVQPDNFAENIRDMADVHFAYSTTDGHLSLRSEVIGSFFVQALCEVFFARAHEDNLDTLMNKVTDRVNRMKGKLYDHESKEWIVVNQTPECVKRMRKAVYFLPKYSTHD